MKYLCTLLCLLLSCTPKAADIPTQATELVKFRSQPTPPTEAAEWLLAGVTNGTWDSGLERATRHLVQASPDRLGRLSPRAVHTALAAAGYPGYARFSSEITGGGPPEQLRAELHRGALQRSQPVDLAMAQRRYADGTVLWIGAVAHRPVLLDPLPKTLDLDERLGVGVEVLDPESSDPLARLPNPVLFITPPFGPVRSMRLTPGTTRWVDGFIEPGHYQLEVVGRGERTTQVVLKWSVYVDTPPPAAVSRLQRGGLENPNPAEATEALYRELNRIRSEAGLQPVARFVPFEALAREHAALMASTGVVDHRIPGVSPGVAARAQQRFHPGSRSFENLAAAPSWQEALDMVLLSPGHLANFFCEECTHASIGVALEPIIDRVPRLFVVWELLEFPEGEPQPTTRQ